MNVDFPPHLGRQAIAASGINWVETSSKQELCSISIVTSVTEIMNMALIS